MKKLFTFTIVILALTIMGYSQEGALETFLPETFRVLDTPHDDGESVLVVWEGMEKALQAPEGAQYQVLRAETIDGPFEIVKEAPADDISCSDAPEYFGFSSKMEQFCFIEADAERGKEYFYKIGFSDGTTSVTTQEALSGVARREFFAWNKINNFVVLSLMIFFVILFYNMAKRNPHMFIRKIPGLEVIDEAVGRATEMGKPILYLTGYYDIQQISTISSVNILSHVAKKAAEYRTRIIVPNKWPVCMSVCQEIVRDAYTHVGRPEEYDDKDVFFIAGEQFSYTAAVDGLMMREKPAANFFLGTFAAESLLLAEAGAMTGAIQISGTDSTYQIPFFVVACDYCLIGEELYAASAYLSHEPKLMGTLKTSDTMKILIAIMLFVGTMMVTINAWAEIDVLDIIKNFFTVLV